MSPLFENLEEEIPDDVYDKLGKMKDTFGVENIPKHCHYCGGKISHRWTYSSEKLCTFEIYCINCDKKAAFFCYDSNYTEFV